MKTPLAICTTVVLSFVYPLLECQGALVLNANYSDSTFGAWDSTRRAVIETAIADWQSHISGLDDGMGGVTSLTIDFTVTFTNVPNSYLGIWGPNFVAQPGSSIRPWSPEVTHTINFNSFWDTGDNRLWWDPTPADDGLDKAFPDFDALTVARHEIGHLLGFTGIYGDNFALPSQTSIWDDQIVNNVFDPSGLSVAMQPGDTAHVLADTWLMDNTLTNAEGRINISDLEVQMLAKAYGYSTSAVPESSSIPIGMLAIITVASRRKR